MMDYLSDADQETVRTILVDAGAPDSSLRGGIKSMLKKVGHRVASESGEALMDQASEYVGPLLSAAVDDLIARAQELFTEADDE